MVNIRVARVEDLPGMQACNLHNLPENYTMKYYLFYLLSCPQLSYVAEDEGRIVGYILARMDDDDKDKADKEAMGHVVSLSVMRTYRRLGLAKRLMIQSQEAMAGVHGAASVMLHVRKSNRAAFSLYKDNLGFTVHDVEKGYYGDGEDAYVMRCSLKGSDASAAAVV
ncbi:acyl-CoA N-acyltransferase [Epithele typhae]|uniref:acyl-CoA N-acyltransferase n=1 Tax=Epithele typhae TaxID=378194 RepID=UPI002008989A|nr:acyl-CoA N-acyltransferase [Epithele typhae]KAH9939061.1 acyl-CoA N-acyltransferase [Epithele typhae]